MNKTCINIFIIKKLKVNWSGFEIIFDAVKPHPNFRGSWQILIFLNNFQTKYEEKPTY